MTSHRLLPVLLAGALGACTPVYSDRPVRAMPEHHTPQPTAPIFDSAGWVLLGSQPVNGRLDRDVFRVSKHARYDRLAMVVYDSDLELLDFVVKFANGEVWSPSLRHVFREGQRSRTIDLPGDDRHISEIELVYKNLPGGGAARVEIYGKDVKPVATRPSPMHHEDPPPPPEPEWNPQGWTLLGSQTVEGKRDRDVYKVDKKQRYDKLMIVVKDGDLEMAEFVVQFHNGDKWEPKVRHEFKPGSRSRSIDLPGADRHIKQIEVKYGNIPGGARARVEIYGIDTTQGKDPKPRPRH